MRRFLVPLFVVIFILAMLAVLIARGGEIVTVIQNGQGIVSFILSLVQLVGIALVLGLAIFVIIEYARYIRSNRFIFEGFSNASKLIEAGHMPFDLGILAREELILQFLALNRDWGEISGRPNADGDLDALLTDSLFLGKSREKLDLRKHVPAELIGSRDVLKELNDVIQSVKDSEGINLMALAEEIVPKEVTPVMKFVEAIAPPHIIRATGYLQWRRDDQDGTGISFEFVDLGSQKDLMVRTIWWKSKETEAETNKGRNAAQASFIVNLDDEKVKPRLAKNEQVQESDEDEFSLAAKRYIELLEPAMRWLALMFWKQNMISNIPRSEIRRKAQALYLFGALYYACSTLYKTYSNFFCQLAIEQFRKASTVDSDWGMPYLYLANLYSFKMQSETGELRKQLLDAALDLYEKALNTKSVKGDLYTRQRINIAEALAELTYDVSTTTGEKPYARKAVKKIEQSMLELDPASFDPGRPDCATYLYNLALWLGYAATQFPSSISITWSTQNTRRYVAYCLACSEDLWNTVKDNEIFQEICGEDELDYLKGVLDARQAVSSRLAELKGNDFKQAVNDVLGKVTKQFEGWVTM